MGKDGSGADSEGSVRAVKPPPDRLYGRARGHKLRPRQETLLEVTLPRLLFREADAADPARAFPFADSEHRAPGLPPPELWFEVGFGGGEHTIAQVRANPGAALIACEVFENGICSLLSALVPEDGNEAVAALPPNLRLWTDDARTLLRAFPDSCLDRLFLMFPDPWPKMRHAKRRFVHPDTVKLVSRVIKPGGEWRVASDDPTYQAWVTEVMAAQTLFDAPPPATERPAGWPPTRYEAKALRAGRQPLYWSFTRRSSGG